MRIETWDMDPGLREELNAHYKTRLAPALKDGGALGAVRAVTFDGVAPEITPEDVERFLDFVDRHFLFGKLRGVGLEVGAGPGTFSALFAKRSAVERVYAVDACEAIVRDLMPAVVAHLAGLSEGKVVGCVGDFSRIGLPDASVDFVFDFFSLHHADDLGRTVRELARILKPGGFVLCFDKARADQLTDAQVQALLDREYSAAFKRTMGVDPGTRWTRRMNGEKEYRLREWRGSFTDAGFGQFEHHHLARIRSANPAVKIGKKLFALLPPRLQGRLMDLLPLKPQNDLSPRGRVYTDLLERFPKEISLMIAYKKGPRA